MAKRIITISREFGSGGRFIGEEVAKNRAGKLNRIEAAHHLRLRRWKNQIDGLYLL